MRNILLLFSAALLFACNSQKTSYSRWLNNDSLPVQSFVIDNEKDTMLHTANGALITISKESFSAPSVRLQAKEAYTLPQMILAGLTTQTGGKPLSSGGMIYLNTDKDVRINKAIGISIPANSYDDKMQVYKGVEKDGKIDWQEPKRLKDTLSPYLQFGKRLFQQICTNCHSYNKNLMAPAMKGLEGRGPWKDRNELIQFTRNVPKYMQYNCYVQNLKHQYGTMMVSFPALPDESLNAIYDYIRNEDIKNGVDLTNTYDKACNDSCRRFDSLQKVIYERQKGLQNERANTMNGQDERINYERLEAPSQNENGTISKVAPDNYVSTEQKTFYYRFDIVSTGWYNIDKLFELPSEITIKANADEALTNELDYFIAVPEYKIFDRGGKLADGKFYGFWSVDGRVKLPVGARVIVFVLGEKDTDVVYGYKEFITAEKNEVNLLPQRMSKEIFNQAIKSLKLDAISFNANNEDGEKIRKIDIEIKNLEKLLEEYKPKNCNCNCWPMEDSSVSEKLDFSNK